MSGLFARAFELTPEGMMKTAEVDKSESITHSTGRKLEFAVIGRKNYFCG